jgi:hypothetical protein
VKAAKRRKNEAPGASQGEESKKCQIPEAAKETPSQISATILPTQSSGPFFRHDTSQ